MAIWNIHETLLVYTKEKKRINGELSSNMMNLLNSSKQIAAEQTAYNQTLDDIYFEYYEADPETYEILMEQAEQDHELELSVLNAWEEELELEKNNLETQLNEVNTFENTWTKLLQGCIKHDFSYGQVQQ